MLYILQCKVENDIENMTLAQVFLKLWIECAISIFFEDEGSNIAVAIKLLVTDLP